MTKIRMLVFLMTIVVVGVVGTVVFRYARGERFDLQTFSFTPNGLFVAKSHPDGAQIYIDGELKTATNATLTLPPGIYDVIIRKEGFNAWHKRLTIEEEVVLEATAHLFRIAPSLSPITFSGISKIQPSPDMTKIAYIVPSSPGNQDAEGLWVMDTVNLPLGFTRDPRRITDGDLQDSLFIWSPDSSKILIITDQGNFLFEIGSFTPQTQRVNISMQTVEMLETWEEERSRKLEAQLRRLPDEMNSILARLTSSVVFSPDENMVIYTASSSATIPPNLIRQLPGSSTQRQVRDINDGQTYVYDIKEDRNFFITDEETTLDGWVKYSDYIDNNTLSLPANEIRARASWYTSSRHVILANDSGITIMDYDGTNIQNVYSGSYIAPHAFPTLSLDRLLILTDLGAGSDFPNLYSLGIK